MALLTSLTKRSDAEWTADEDQKLKAMKAENKSWKEIAAEMGRTQQQLKARFKEIKDTDAANGGKGDSTDENNNPPANEGKKERSGKQAEKKAGKVRAEKVEKARADKAEKAEKARADKAEKAEKDRAEKAEAKTALAKIRAAEKIIKDDKEKRKMAKVIKATKTLSTKTPSRRHEATFPMRQWATIAEDDFFSRDELQCLAEIILKDQGQTWLRVASKFFDLTGRRIHPEDIREKMEESIKLQ